MLFLRVKERGLLLTAVKFEKMWHTLRLQITVW